MIKHTIEGFERDILPILKENGQRLISQRFPRPNSYGHYWANSSTVCLVGALATAKSAAFSVSEKKALEGGFRGLLRRLRPRPPVDRR